MHRTTGSFVASVALSLIACRVEIGPPERQGTETEGAPASGKVVVYTSMYRHVIDRIVPVLERELPGIEVEWLQGGSEKLATRVDAELAAGAPHADLVMTSDPFWYERLHREGHLLPYASIRALAMPRELVHPDGAFATSRISTMVLAYNTRILRQEEAPRRMKDLGDPRWKGRLTMPDPLGSGTAFTTLAFLVHVEGVALMAKIKENQVVASGGNSAVITRIESGEHAAGMVLLENVLAAKTRGAPIAYVVPEEGAVLIPGPIAILRGARNADAAKLVYDVVLSREVQALIVEGLMHSPFESVAPPEGTSPLTELLRTRYEWSEGFVEHTVSTAHALRERFAALMGGH